MPVLQSAQDHVDGLHRAQYEGHAALHDPPPLPTVHDTALPVHSAHELTLVLPEAHVTLQKGLKEPPWHTLQAPTADGSLTVHVATL